MRAKEGDVLLSERQSEAVEGITGLLLAIIFMVPTWFGMRYWDQHGIIQNVFWYTWIAGAALFSIYGLAKFFEWVSFVIADSRQHDE